MNLHWYIVKNRCLNAWNHVSFSNKQDKILHLFLKLDVWIFTDTSLTKNNRANHTIYFWNLILVYYLIDQTRDHLPINRQNPTKKGHRSRNINMYLTECEQNEGLSSKSQILPKFILRHGSNNASHCLLQNRKNPIKLIQFTKSGKNNIFE